LPMDSIQINPLEKKVAKNYAPSPWLVLHDSLFKPLDKLKLVADFNADGQLDTLVQEVVRGTDGKFMKRVPDPYKTSWMDTVMVFMYQRKANVVLFLKGEKSDTLYPGKGMGLYCLLDLGDLNGDGRSEISLVVDHYDMSRVNSCHIYTLCGRNWKELMAFEVHEDAFNFPPGYTNENPPIFNKIEGYLEKRKGKWKYFDYAWEFMDTPAPSSMKALRLPKCDSTTAQRLDTLTE